MRFLIAALLPASLLLGDDSERLVFIDHFVRPRSAVPVMAGQDAEIYSERAGVALGTTSLSKLCHNRLGC